MNTFLTSALFWFLLGIFFLLVEIYNYGFIFFFFGIGAFIVAMITWIGIIDSLTVQILMFLIISLVSLVFFRNTLSDTFKGKIFGKLKPGQSFDDIKGEKAIVLSKIEPNKLDGKVEYHGTVWYAQSDEILEKGHVVEIVERVDLTLKVKKVS
ncbi:MAG: NfeD family protein [Ignavibacteriae bacterium]|nr:NfeD family protein [Ignavibacteriota bacterium]